MTLFAPIIFVFSCCVLGSGVCLGEDASDSVAAAITVYRNPDFFENETSYEKTGGEEEEQRDAEEQDGEENEDAFDAEKESLYDFDDNIYRYSGEPRRPNPPAAPDFPSFFDESEEYESNPSDADGPSRSSKANGYHGSLHSGSDDDPERNHSFQGENEESVDEERSYGREEIFGETDVSSDAGKYRVLLDGDPHPGAKPKPYRKTSPYHDTVFGTKAKSFGHETGDFDYYPVLKKYEDRKETKRTVYADGKKGTREYYKDHELEEVVEMPRGGNAKSGTKHVFQTVSKIGIKALKPIPLKPYSLPKFRTKIKFAFWPVNRVKVRIGRQVPDDSVYELNSDYDSDYEFVSSP